MGRTTFVQPYHDKEWMIETQKWMIGTAESQIMWPIIMKNILSFVMAVIIPKRNGLPFFRIKKQQHHLIRLNSIPSHINNNLEHLTNSFETKYQFNALNLNLKIEVQYAVELRGKYPAKCIFQSKTLFCAMNWLLFQSWLDAWPLVTQNTGTWLFGNSIERYQMCETNRTGKNASCILISLNQIVPCIDRSMKFVNKFLMRFCEQDAKRRNECEKNGQSKPFDSLVLFTNDTLTIRIQLNQRRPFGVSTQMHIAFNLFGFRQKIMHRIVGIFMQTTSVAKRAFVNTVHRTAGSPDRRRAWEKKSWIERG